MVWETVLLGDIARLGAMLGSQGAFDTNTGDGCSYGVGYADTDSDMPYLFVKSWRPNTKINGTGTRSAGNSANHVCCAFPF